MLEPAVLERLGRHLGKTMGGLPSAELPDTLADLVSRLEAAAAEGAFERGNTAEASRPVPTDRPLRPAV